MSASAERLGWVVFLPPLLGAAGLAAVDPARWGLYVAMVALLAVLWPFHVELAPDVDLYLPLVWTSTAGAYLLGFAILPTLLCASLLGFWLIVRLDAAGLLPASGLVAESIRHERGEPVSRDVRTEGQLGLFAFMSSNAVRVVVLLGAQQLSPQLPLLACVLVGEVTATAWMTLIPMPGRMTPQRFRANLTATLGRDMLHATDLLHFVMVSCLLLAYAEGGLAAFAAVSVSTLAVHAVVKRLNDTRLESERRRRELVAVRTRLKERERLATIGETAASVFQQIARHHGSIGMFAHLVARGPGTAGPAEWAETVRGHAERIATSVGEARRVMDELLRFGQDRSLNLYPQPLAHLVEECVRECEARVRPRYVEIALAPGVDAVVLVDKHKVKQALANVLDNAIEATPAGGRVEVAASLEGATARITVRDSGPGIAEEVRARLFTPFCTTKRNAIGLGLVLARELLEAHGGAIAWRPAAPGTEFVLTFPERPEEAARRRSGRAPG